MPFETEDLISTHMKIIQNIENILMNSAKDLVDSKRIMELKQELMIKMQKDFSDKEQMNSKKSLTNSKNLLYSFLNGFKLPIIENVDNLKVTLIKEKLIELNSFLTVYNKKARGPHKCKQIKNK